MNDRNSKNTTKSPKREIHQNNNTKVRYLTQAQNLSFYQSEMQLKRQKNKEGKGKGTDEDTIQKYSNKINKTFL